jgi:GNAT superfamily N-acetyltransferase
MSFTIQPFDISFLNQLEELPPAEWQSNAYQLFLDNEWQPWFYPFQVIEADRLIGFGMFFLFNEFAWLGWILVHKEFRNKGIGTAITNYLINKATELGAKGFILTATEMGKPIYEKIGFTTTSYYRFFKLPEMFEPIIEKQFIRKAIRNDLSSILELDYLATGEKRSMLIENNIDDCWIYESKKIDGFYLPGLVNGFIAALSEKAGIALLNLRCSVNKKLVVVPEENKITINYLLENNFTEEYKIPRMTLGEEPKWQPGMIFNRASGYCG